MQPARLLDLGKTSAVRSQAVYHAVALCAAASDRPTLCVVFPDRPYVSIGYHQQADREIDLVFCRERDIPVVRRMVGGGAVLLDSNQLFFHLVVPKERVAELGLPQRLDERYPRLAAPAIAAYRALGVVAEFRSPNDIHVGGRKIGGTGAADIGDAFVFVGSMMLAFDHSLMARVLRFGEERLRQDVLCSIERHVTSLESLLGTRPSMDAVHEALLAGFRQELGVGPAPGSLLGIEEAKVEELEELFASDRWLHHIAWHPGRPRKLAINCAVRYVEGETADGVRVAVRLVDGRVDDVLIHGGVAGDAADGVDRERADVVALTRKLAEVS
jgi:lipoate---protein ligase